MKENWKRAFMDTAKRFAEESYAVRLQVGAIVVKNDKIISIGINGTPSGWENVCEDKEYSSGGGWLDVGDMLERWPYEEISDDGLTTKRYRLVTKPETLHAERNALDKITRSVESAEDAVLFVTHSPCLECAKSIYGAGIKEVYYATEYRDSDGIDFLKKCDILVEKMN